MKKHTFRKVLPFVLSAAFAVTVVSGTVEVPFTQGTPLQAATAYASTTKAWDFTKDIGAWQYSGNYNYNGKAVPVAYDPAFGGSLKATVDFSKDSDATWSEVKLTDASITSATPIELNNSNTLEFDLYYDPSKIGGDSLLKVKVFGKDANGEEVINDLADNIGMQFAKPVEGSNFKRVHVKVPFMDTFTGKLGHLEVSIVSYLSSYNGDIYINSLKM